MGLMLHFFLRIMDEPSKNGTDLRPLLYFEMPAECQKDISDQIRMTKCSFSCSFLKNTIPQKKVSMLTVTEG